MTLLLMLMTSTTAWAGFQQSKSPIGWVDGAEGSALYVHVWGWSCDPYYETDCDDANEINSFWFNYQKFFGSTIYYNACDNQVEIHLQQGGQDRYVYVLDTRVNRGDAAGQFHKCPKEIGFDNWLKVDAPGNYHLVAYSTNAHGSEGKSKIGERDITVSSAYTIRYDANGGNCEVPATQSKDNRSNVTLSTTKLTREGYTFLGWNTEASSEGIHYNPGATYSTNASVTLYAQWVPTSFYRSYKTLRTVDDWNNLATMVNNGCNIKNQTIRLANDIGDDTPITRCIGTTSCPFQCIFEGDTHSITVNINDTRHEGTAPFRVVASDAGGSRILQNLIVKGTVRGGKYCSGMIGISRGSSVWNCDIQTNVITNSTHCAGVIGYVNHYNTGSVSCTHKTIFSGSISGATKATGIFIGGGVEGRNGNAGALYCLAMGTISGANIELVHHPYNPDVRGNYKIYNLGQQGTYIPYDPEAILSLFEGFCLDDDGRIRPFYEYVQTAADWDNIATRVANGVSFKGHVLKLKSDITVSTMIGTEEHPFDGCFDGKGKTVTFNLETTESGCAPFRYIKDAEIGSLKVDGTIHQTVGAKSRIAGLVAYASGKNSIHNNVVFSTLRTSGASVHHAGFVAQIDGSVDFRDCDFKGRMLCDGDSYSCGGFVAINNGYGTSFDNCVFAPVECTWGAEGSATFTRDIKEFAKIGDAFYTHQLGRVQGTLAYTSDMLGDDFYVKFNSANASYYKIGSVSFANLQTTYDYADGDPIDISYTIKCNGSKVFAYQYTATITKNTEGTEATEVTEVTDIGRYTLSVTAKENSGYAGTVEKDFFVTATSLAKNEKGHFLISSTDDWNTLCNLSTNEYFDQYHYFGDQVVELTSDITVNSQIPIFCGILEGNGHKLTFNYGTAQNPITANYAAPIYYFGGHGVVQNLHVDGTIFTSGRYAGGIAGLARDNVRINNCRSSIRIKTTYNGECYNGGLVGLVDAGDKLAINNSLFDGCFTNENNTATHWAGFVGRVNTYGVSINSCLYFANRHEMSVPSENNATFYLPTYAPVTFQNCCHTEQRWGEEQQGTYVADNLEAGPQMTALGYDGWYIKYDYPQWQAYYQEGQEWPLVLPRTDYHTAVVMPIDGLEGSGTAADPFLIGSTQDWNLFATSINNNVGAEAYYQLTDNITIDQGHLVGTTVPYSTVNVLYGERRTFRGTFDGNGHTLTLNMATNGDCAPFLYAQGCTIKNLTIGGTISTSGQRAAGLIANAAGTVNITGCRSNLTINSSYNGESSYAGLVAQSTGITNIEGCVFDGNITGTTFCIGNCNITNSFYTKPAQTGQGTAVYSVTAAEGVDMSIGGDGVLREYGNGIAIKGDGLLLDGVFYAPAGAEVPIETLELITGYSPQNVTIAASAGTYADGTLTMPAQNVVFGTSSPIALNTYTIHFDANGGTGDAMADMNFTYGDDPVALTANTYTLTANSFTGWNTEADGSGTAYTDGQTVKNLTTVNGTTITLYAQWEPWIAEGFGTTDSYTPDGTAEHPYVISTTEDWDLLCDYISSDKGGLASAHYRLAKNITVSRMMGTITNPFRGTFDGTAHTLTLDLTGLDPVEEEPEEVTEGYGDIDDPEDPEDPEEPEDPETPEIPENPDSIEPFVEETLHALAPFAYVNGGTIKNLHTVGTINGESSYFAGGIVGKTEGNTTLQSCYSSVAITSTATIAEGDEESPMLGGIVAQSSGTLNFTDCLFDGSILAENTSHCGGFLGQRVSGTVTFTNCLMDGELNCDTNGCGTYYQADETDAYTFTNSNSYYHTAYGAEQGTQTYDTGDDLKYDLGENWTVTDTEDVVPFIVITDLKTAKLTIASAFSWTGSAITLGYTMANYYGETMEEGTHYTATIRNAEDAEVTDVIDCGPYTLTINGAGDYIGSKTAHFYVCKLDENGFPFEIDEDFNFEDAGYYFVRLPADWEDNPKLITIPEGFTHSFKVYDDNGKTKYDVWGYDIGIYVDSGTLQIVAPDGSAFNVQGTIKIEDGDNLTVYDGTHVGSNRIYGPASGEQNVHMVTYENSIIFDFYSDGTESDEGLDLTVTLEPQLPITDLADDDSEKAESEKNASVIAANDGDKLSVSLTGRTLYRDGTWNTLCLPFDIPDIQSTLLRGATIKTFSSTAYENGMLTLNFSDDLTSIEAGKPYIVKWTDIPIIYSAYAGTRNSDSNEYYNVDFENIFAAEDVYWYLEDGKYSDENPFCEFNISEPMNVTGYTMCSDDGPRKWTLKGKLNESDEWTLIDSREVIYTEENNYEDEDEVTYEGTTYTLAVDKQDIYRFFRLDVLELDNENNFNLWGFKLEGDVVPGNFVDPVFGNVTIKDELQPVTDNGIIFGGSYGSLDDTDGLFLDAHNADGNAFHATFSQPGVIWYTDAERTTLLTTAIPFAADGTVTLYPTWTLTLENNDSQPGENGKNTAIISNSAQFPATFNVTLADRTLYKDGDWNTLCLPFNLGDADAEDGHYFDGTLLEGATVKTLESTSFEDGTLTMTFADATSIEAGKPYIVKWTTTGDNIVNPVFSNVLISTATANVSTDYADFCGTYNYMGFNAEDKSILFLGQQSTLYYPQAGASIGACRAYFQLKGITAGQVNSTRMFFGDDETGISEKVIVKSEKFATAAGWYTLDGRKLDGRPTKKGLYIHGGRTVVIK